ncbi:unnamed protein product, partial [Chrysoparadoxa australica]
ELRFELDKTETLTIVLREGSAEIFGIELAPNRDYSFSNSKQAVFTWYGCTLETRGGVASIYKAQQSIMVAYANTHAQLEARRDSALAALVEGRRAHGPRVLVAGPVDSGKSTLCKILTAYAVRLGRCPLEVDLDVGQGEITVPGAIAACSHDSSTLAVDQRHSYTAPLAFFYGHTSVDENPEYFKHLISRAAVCVNERAQQDQDTNASGVIINTGGYIAGLGFKMLCHAIAEFSVDVVLILGSDKLYSDLWQLIHNGTFPALLAIKHQRSDGVICATSSARRAARNGRIHQYFYGDPEEPPLSPSVLELSFDDVKVYPKG